LAVLGPATYAHEVAARHAADRFDHDRQIQ
jgi:hypothetical protein